MSNRVQSGTPRRCAGFLGCASGVAGIEFAIICPLLVILIIGTFSVGWAMHCVSSVDYVLEQTSRILQLNPTLTQTALQSLLDKDLDQYGNQAVQLAMVVDKDSYGSNVAHLTASYSYEINVPLVAKYTGAITRKSDVFLTVSN